MEKLPRIIVLAVLSIFIIGAVFVVSTRGQQPKGPFPGVKDTFYAPPVAKAGAPKETTVGSPDGKLNLKMKEEKGKNDVTYTFWVLNLSDGSQKEILSKTVPAASVMTIPKNTFSPDDKYIFLKETGVGEAHYLVLSTSGAPLTKDVLTAEVSGLFVSKYPDFTITDVTGWGGVGLIVVNTDKEVGGTGPSFWFEVPSGGFIQLGTRFN